MFCHYWCVLNYLYTWPLSKTIGFTYMNKQTKLTKGKNKECCRHTKCQWIAIIIPTLHFTWIKQCFHQLGFINNVALWLTARRVFMRHIYICISKLVLQCNSAYLTVGKARWKIYWGKSRSNLENFLCAYWHANSRTRTSGALCWRGWGV